MTMYLPGTENFPADFLSDVKNIVLDSEGCGICDGDHLTEKCEIFENVCQVKDREVPPRALLTLPNDLKVETLSDGEKTVIALKTFDRGTKFGPFKAGALFSFYAHDLFPIKIFSVDKDREIYLDKEEHQSNWMCYVLPASNIEEQNLVCYQEKNEIFYVARRQIKVGEQLKVWYSKKYASKLNVKLLSLLDIDDSLQNSPGEPECVMESLSTEGLQKQKQLEYFLASVKELTRNDEFNGIESMDCFSVDNLPDELVDQLSFCTGLGDVDALGSLFSDNPKVSKLAEEKSIADFSLELVENVLPKLDSESTVTSDVDNKHSQVNKHKLKSPHKKQKPKLLCQYCSKLFVRQENLKNHKCAGRVNEPGPFVCTYCPRSYRQQKYLNRHLQRHIKKLTCQNCHIKFDTPEQKIIHICNKGKPSFDCTVCYQQFTKETYLNRHIKYTHEKNVHRKVQDEAKSFVCEICSRQFSYASGLKTHMKSHGQPEYKCAFCNREFRRADIYAMHVLTHGPPTFQCKLCSHKSKTKKCLDVHMTIHAHEKKFPCDICGKTFNQRSNMLKHKKTHSNKHKKCEMCEIVFGTRHEYLKHKNDKHAGERIHKCPKCDKHYETPSLLRRHFRILHSGKSFVCGYCFETFYYRDTFKRHLKRKHSNKNEDWDNPEVINNFIVDTNEVTAENAAMLVSGENTVSSEAETNTSVLLSATPNSEENLLNFCGDLGSLGGTDPVLPDTTSNQETLANVVILPAENNLANSEVLLSLPEPEQEPLDNSFINEGYFILHVLDEQ